MRAGLRPWPRVWGRGGPEGAPAWRFGPQSPPGAYLLPASRAAGRSGPSPCPAGRGRTGRLGLGCPLGPCRTGDERRPSGTLHEAPWAGKRAGECCPEPLAGAQPGDRHLGRAGPGRGVPQRTRPPGSPCGQAAPRGRAAWRAGPIGGWGPLRGGLGVAAARLSRAACPLTVAWCAAPRPGSLNEREALRAPALLTDSARGLRSCWMLGPAGRRTPWCRLRVMYVGVTYVGVTPAGRWLGAAEAGAGALLQGQLWPGPRGCRRIRTGQGPRDRPSAPVLIMGRGHRGAPRDPARTCGAEHHSALCPGWVPRGRGDSFSLSLCCAGSSSSTPRDWRLLRIPSQVGLGALRGPAPGLEPLAWGPDDHRQASRAAWGTVSPPQLPPHCRRPAPALRWTLGSAGAPSGCG